MLLPSTDFSAEPLTSGLDGQEKVFRLALMNRIIDTGGPVVPDDESCLPATERQRALQGLIKKNRVVMNGAGRINFVYPVSAMPTAHRVTLSDGRSLFAMCGIDAMGTAFTFEQDVSIASRCSECSVPVTLEIRSGRIASLAPHTTHVLHVDLAKFGNWAEHC